MALTAGFGGAARDACVTLCTPDRVLGICAQERITRVRAAGFNASGLPDEALDALLRRSGHDRSDITTYAVAEDVPALAANPLRLDHHFGHACAAFLPSPFDTATIVVCDDQSPAVTVWSGEGTDVRRIDWPWEGIGFAELYSRCAESLGFSPSHGHEQRMEALARLAAEEHDRRAEVLFDRTSDRLQLAPEWMSRVEDWVRGADLSARSSAAAALQSRIADLVTDFIAEVNRHTPARQGLCLGGSLFFNSHINARLKSEMPGGRVYIPVDPGNGGLSVGAALHANDNARLTISPFMGPSFSDEEIKPTIDNCKLTYRWASESDRVAIAVDALEKGHLVAWFDGPMECGARALGGRSILANPFAPYVLDNLNRFLKQREVWRGYALSGLEHAVAEHFSGPDRSPFMECDYAPRDPNRFKHILPQIGAKVRLHTVGPDGPIGYRALLAAFGEKSGLPLLVNTSFNGFREPIVCTPRDAIRVFFGTGLDVLVLGQFVVTK